MKKTISYGAAVVQGDWPVQEDGFFIDPLKKRFALADGFGGRGAGDIAVKIALHYFRDYKQPEDGNQDEGSSHINFLQQLNKQLLSINEKKTFKSRGGCSFLLSHLSSQRKLTITGIGACSAFLVRGGKLFTLLSAQSDLRGFSPFLIPDSALGIKEQILPEQRQWILQSGDLAIMVTSGFYWESEGFFPQLLQLLAQKAEGANLSHLASSLAEQMFGPGFSLNRGFIAFETL